MSQRLGMADGRCFTINTASRLFNDFVMQSNGIRYEDNYSYRQFLQKNGLKAIHDIQALQNTVPPKNSINQCQACDLPLLKVPNTY